MDENWSNNWDPDKPSNNTRTIGMVLLGLGVVLAGWVVTIIFRLITGDGTQEIVSNLIQMESLTITITTSSEGMVVPESFFMWWGCFSACFC
jgi:hypothetical protein